MEEEPLGKLKTFIEENKGKRKFTQSVELAVNFKGIDFTKQDNRLNLEIKLPHGKGRDSKAVVFADDAKLAEKAAAAGAKVIPSSQLQSLSSNKAQMTDLLNYELVAQPSMMPQIAKSLGQFLGPKNKIPRPLIGEDVSAVISNISKSIYLRSKGKYLPTIHCLVGTESMKPEDISSNIDEVINSLAKKVGKANIKSAYVKLTMSKPLRII